MPDLFASEERLEKIPLEGAELYYLAQMALPESNDFLLSQLINDTPWKSETVTVWGKTFKQPRLIAWYGDGDKNYRYSGIRLTPLPWTPLLLSIKKAVELTTKSSFNSVLLNYYRDNRDSMGFHSDDEPELGSRPTIASLSLGGERTFILKHKEKKSSRPIRLLLKSGSLLLMTGDTQKNWKHGIDKETRRIDARVNLTFRTIL